MLKSVGLVTVLILGLSVSSFARILERDHENWDELSQRLSTRGFVILKENYTALQERFFRLRASDQFKKSVSEIVLFASFLGGNDSSFKIYSAIVSDYRDNVKNPKKRSLLSELLDVEWGEEATGIDADVYRFGDAIRKSIALVNSSTQNVNLSALYSMYRDYFEVAFMGKARDDHPLTAECFKPFESLLDEMLTPTCETSTQTQSSDLDAQINQKAQERSTVTHHGLNKSAEEAAQILTGRTDIGHRGFNKRAEAFAQCLTGRKRFW